MNSQIVWTAIAAFLLGCTAVLIAWTVVEMRHAKMLNGVRVEILNDQEWIAAVRERMEQLGPLGSRGVTIHHFINDNGVEVSFDKNGFPKSYYTRPTAASIARLRRMLPYATCVQHSYSSDRNAPSWEEHWLFPTPLPSLKESEPS